MVGSPLFLVKVLVKKMLPKASWIKAFLVKVRLMFNESVLL
jgi:hypothetical protein